MGFSAYICNKREAYAVVRKGESEKWGKLEFENFMLFH
jgi:hypothetical protein